MAGQEFIVLYTHQKRKKAKVWHDGILTVGELGSKAVLHSEDHKRLDHIHIKPNQMTVGAELESEKYLITIEEVKTSTLGNGQGAPPSTAQGHATQPGNLQRPLPRGRPIPPHTQATASSSLPTGPAQSMLPRRQPLKRKRTGFVPPRQLNKQQSPAKDDYSTVTEHQTLKERLQLPVDNTRVKPSLFSVPSSQRDLPAKPNTNIMTMYRNALSRNPDSVCRSTSGEPPNAVRSNSSSNTDDHYHRQEITVDSGLLNVQAGTMEHVPVKAHSTREQFSSLPTATPSAETQGERPGIDGMDCGGDTFDDQSLHTESSDSNAIFSRTPVNYPSRNQEYTNDNPSAVRSTEGEIGGTALGRGGPSKRSASQILALLGRGKKPFRPPLKIQKEKSEEESQREFLSTIRAQRSIPSNQQRDSAYQNVTSVLKDAVDVSERTTMNLIPEASQNRSKSGELPPMDASFEMALDPSSEDLISSRTCHGDSTEDDTGGYGKHDRVVTSYHMSTNGAGGERKNAADIHLQKPTTTGAMGAEKDLYIKKSRHHLSGPFPQAPLNEGKTGTQTQSQSVHRTGYDGMQRRGATGKGFRTPVLKELSSSMGMSSELSFPAAETAGAGAVPQRRVVIPVSFMDVGTYKQVMMAAVKEHLNILLFTVSHRYHSAMAKVDLSSYTRTTTGTPGGGPGEGQPLCKHGQPAKIVCVKKDGPNKGRMFYACSNQRENQCKFFVWADQHTTQTSQPNENQLAPQQGRGKIALHGAESIEKFARAQQIHLNCEGQLTRRGGLKDGLLSGAPAWVKKYRAQQVNSAPKKLYLRITRKEHSSTYAKDDLWVISQDLTFHPSTSFVAKSVFHGPSSSNEIEIEPVAGYSPSNWPSEGNVYGILVCNASSELTCLDNIQDYVNPRTFPVLPHLISSSPNAGEKSGAFRGPAFVQPSLRQLHVSQADIDDMVEASITTYHLNADQAAALQQVAAMLRENLGDTEGTTPPITLIHGVFGAGKSYLLAVTVLFLVSLFKRSEERSATKSNDWKVLIASTTNVAVDRILLGLLDLDFEDFIRVGSMRKIAKPVLPYSVHASDKENQEVRELQEMLKGDLTLSEKHHVRRSLERQRCGQNKEMLSKVRVVGVTCAACSFPCIKNLAFPVVLLDECSQMTEPSSLLPLARFGCEKLVLVGDPNQLDPTIQGSEPAHRSGLEQTLFDRLSLLGHDPIMLRTQYRCHPTISGLSNSLFYHNQLLDGVIEEDRPPLVTDLPTLCFFNVAQGKEETSHDGSCYNPAEASFVVFLISGLLKMGVAPKDVGVVTLYRAQVGRIASLLQNSSCQNVSELKAIQISTVDAFQGGEKSIIILSCVRTQRVGFIDSDKRTNVALTRSKNHLLIVGGMKMLYENPLWGQIIRRCDECPNGLQDSRAFQKQWEELLRKMEEQEEAIADDATTAAKSGGGGKERKQKKKRKKRPRLEKLTDVDGSPAMSFHSDDDDFVSSNIQSASISSPVPFDATTPITPTYQMEWSIPASEQVSPGSVHLPSEGPTLCSMDGGKPNDDVGDNIVSNDNSGLVHSPSPCRDSNTSNRKHLRNKSLLLPSPGSGRV